MQEYFLSTHLGGVKKKVREKPVFYELQFRGMVDNAPTSVLLAKLYLQKPPSRSREFQEQADFHKYQNILYQ
jgi:hypothetical protein